MSVFKTILRIEKIGFIHVKSSHRNFTENFLFCLYVLNYICLTQHCRMQTASIPTIHYTDFFNGEKQQKWDSQSKCPLLNENHHNRNNPHKICDVVFIANQIPIGKNSAFQHIINSLLSATSVHLDQNLGDKNQQFPKFLKRTSLCMHLLKNISIFLAKIFVVSLYPYVTVTS